MILSAHQPAYLPWLGYFDKIISSDVFIYLDTVQFEKNSFTNRNRIKTPQGAQWLSIPVKLKGHLDKSIKEIEIDTSQNWQKKHLNAILMNYGRAPRFDECFAKLESLYTTGYNLLNDVCWDQLKFWLNELHISTRIVRSSELPLDTRKSDLILDLCRFFGADQYISGALGKNYLVERDFEDAGISITYQEYVHPEYPQLWGDFLPYMSILDLCMNTSNYDLIGKRGPAQ